MPVMPLVTVVLERALNRVLWHDRGLKAARQRLTGKVLTLTLRELEQPLVLYFTETQIDILNQPTEDSDCTVTLSLSVLPELRHRQNLPAMIKQGRFDVSGDIQVIQQFSALADLAEFDPGEYLAPWTGDIGAQLLTGFGKKVSSLLRRDIKHWQQHLGGLLTEEWRAAPGSLEVSWFCEETEAAARQVAALEQRLTQEKPWL